MTSDVRVLDRVVRVAALGVRFRDEATGALVVDDLLVSVRAAARRGVAANAMPNRSGVFVLHDLAGGRDALAAIAEGRDRSWSGPPPRPSIVEVRHRLGHYHACSFSVDLPHPGLYRWPTGGSPPDDDVPLYPSAAWPTPAGLAVVRAALVDAHSGKPAVGAVLAARFRHRATVRGIADARGQVVLAFPYPLPDVTGAFAFDLSPPSGPVAEPMWTLGLSARWDPARTAAPYPDLADTLAQPPARIWLDAAATVPFADPVLTRGRELMLRSMDATGEPSSFLFVTA